MRRGFRVITTFVILTALLALPAASEDVVVPKKHWAKACTYSIVNGEPSFGEPIWVIAEKPSENPEWWVMFPGRPELHKNGRAINWPKDRTVFLFPDWLGTKVPVVANGSQCPKSFWNQTPTVSAAQ